MRVRGRFNDFQELGDLRASAMKNFTSIQVDESNILNWQGLILPVSRIGWTKRHRYSGRENCNRQDFYKVSLNDFQDSPPYNKGAFRIEINFPAEYPFKPPRITFKTKIYHPNVDEKGQVCLPIISAENWKPATKTDQGQSLI